MWSPSFSPPVIVQWGSPRRQRERGSPRLDRGYTRSFAKPFYLRNQISVILFGVPWGCYIIIIMIVLPKCHSPRLTLMSADRIKRSRTWQRWTLFKWAIVSCPLPMWTICYPSATATLDITDSCDTGPLIWRYLLSYQSSRLRKTARCFLDACRCSFPAFHGHGGSGIIQGEWLSLLQLEI